MAATTEEDNDARNFETLTDTQIARLRHEGSVLTLTFSPNGQYVVTGSTDKTARVFQVATGKEIARVIHDSSVSTVTFSQNGQYVATGSLDRTIRIFEPITRELLRLHHSAPVQAVTFSADGQYVLSATGDPEASQPATVSVFELNTGKKLYHLADQNASVAVAFSSDGRYVMLVDRLDHAPRVVEVETHSQTARVGGDNDWGVTKATFGPNARYVATWTGPGDAVRVFEVATGKPVSSLENSPYVSALAFSWDDRHIVLGFDHLDDESASEASLFDARTGEELTRLGHAIDVATAVFSTNGQCVATGGGDGVARVFRVPDGKEILRFNHTRKVEVLAFSPDDRYLGTATDDGAVRVFEVVTGHEVVRLYGEGEIRALMLGHEGKYFYTVSGIKDLIVRRHARVSKDLIDETCSRLTRNLTPEEWNQYLGAAQYRKTCSAIPTQ